MNEPATSHRLTAVGGEARSHDAVGNTTSIGGKTFTYSDANRMNAVKQGNSVLESYAYNHRGERVLRTPAGGAAQITLYDEAGQWLGNYSATGQAQQQAIWLDNYPVALINVPTTGVPELTYVQPDHLGTPRVVIDPVRDVAIWEWSNKSEVFGNQIPSADPDGDGVAFELALRFPGQQATDTSGLFYNYQREYDPAAGRYSQSDPNGLMGGIGTYLYASGKPLSKIDEKGLVDVWVWMPLPYEGGLPSYGKLHSSFGHISTTSNGVDYSFGPAGNSISTNYVSSQLNLRTGIKHTIELTPQQESKLSACLARPQGEYSAINNNCGTPLQNCMREIGKELQPVNMILPESISHLLWWMSDDSTIQRGKR
ncbi:hypothetical protein A7X84_15145 [Stenotrophomonas maltophilia]|nr:hypothetical protein A7X84_15145 [Stenotrophomonas maltophilia]